eukprot:903590_1
MASHCYVDPPVFSNYVGSYNECMDDIANVMENSNNDTTLKHAMVKSQCIVGNVTSVQPSHCTGLETGFKTKPSGDKYADILKEYDEDKHRNILNASLDISE